MIAATVPAGSASHGPGALAWLYFHASGPRQRVGVPKRNWNLGTGRAGPRCGGSNGVGATGMNFEVDGSVGRGLGHRRRQQRRDPKQGKCGGKARANVDGEFVVPRGINGDPGLKPGQE